MFVNSIDNKDVYTNSDGVELVDLSNSIFDSNLKTVTCSFYKVNKEMRMRPDLLSIASYGEDTYTEMIIKYSEICNPFAIDEDDIVAIPSLNSVYNEVKDVILSNSDEENNSYDLVKNYHKYIDKSKIPANFGSQTSDVQGSKTPSAQTNIDNGSSDISNQKQLAAPVEPNMANNRNNGISVINGRIYFGPNVSTRASDITDVDGSNAVDSNLVDCAKNGVTIGQFLNATIKNSLKK